jgi:hypothetical protein
MLDRRLLGPFNGSDLIIQIIGHGSGALLGDVPVPQGGDGGYVAVADVPLLAQSETCG